MSCPGDSTSRPGDTRFFGHSAPAGESHTTALQALSRWMAWGGERVWYGTENFDGTGANWDRVPVVHAQTHPDPVMPRPYCRGARSLGRNEGHL